jgi:hypothetical protein
MWPSSQRCAPEWKLRSNELSCVGNARLSAHQFDLSAAQAIDAAGDLEHGLSARFPAAALILARRPRESEKKGPGRNRGPVVFA